MAQALGFRPDLQRHGDLVAAARAAVDVALADYLPQLDASLTTGLGYTDTPGTRDSDAGTASQWQKAFGLDASQHIFDGFATAGRIDLAEARLAGTAGERRELAEQVAVEAVQAYLDVLRNQAFVLVAEVNLKAHRRLLGQVRQQANAGQVTEADVAQARSREALAEATLAERLGGLATAVAVYVERVGQAPERLTEQDLPMRLRPNNEADAVAIALSSHPSLVTGQAGVAADAAGVQIAASTFWPEVQGTARGEVFDDRDGVQGYGTSVEAGVEVDWNLYNGGGDTAALAEAEALLAASGHDLEERQRQVRESASVAYRELLAAEAMLSPLSDHAEATQQVLAGYRQQFDIGRRSLLDLLDAQSELFNAEVRAVDARYRLLLSYYQLFYAMGGLTPALGVTPPQ